ncbi:MAG: DUF1080 domain-containing protein [Verrucomicrobiota bacterium]
MRLKPHLVVAALLSAGPISGEEPTFETIFNGSDFSGWDFQPGSWEIRDGEIHCTGQSESKNWLIYRAKEPADFVLELEFKWEAGNSGVQVRSEDLGDWQVYGYQVEVARQDVMGLWHHSLMPKDHPKKEARHLMTTAGEVATIDSAGKRSNVAFADAEETQAAYREGEWNLLRIEVKGEALTQSINGVKFATLIDQDEEMSRRSGLIALQDHGKGCQVAFRNIRLQIISE